MAGKLASLLSVDKRWFWLFGVLAVGTLLGGQCCTITSTELRRRFHRGGHGRALTLSAFLTGRMVVLLLTLTVGHFPDGG